MKLKYKKIILLTTMSTMGIGILTLSVSQDRPKAEEQAATTMFSAEVVQDENVEDNETLRMADEALATPGVTAIPTEIPTPTSVPVYAIEQEGAYPEIDELFASYYSAKNNQDIDTLKSTLSDPDKAESEEQLQIKTEYIEDYRNIKTYTKKSMIEGTYIVYVYHEIKFTSINTPAPGLSKFYVITGEDNKLKIFSGDMDSDIKAYYDDRKNDEDFIALVEMTDEKSKKAKEQDEDLKNFWESIDAMASSENSENSEGDSTE
ncbi:MAG: hypothetical protein K0R46_1764 [Herbinix sp.]|jgi:hypothetical protein|nr:hypothetical protein [Herbinix sp.]